MSIQKYSRKIVAMLFIYLAVLVVLRVLFGFADVFVQNQVYLGQMESSDESYAMILVLETLRRYRYMVYFFFWVAFAGSIARETHKFIESDEGENQV